MTMSASTPLKRKNEWQARSWRTIGRSTSRYTVRSAMGRTPEMPRFQSEPTSGEKSGRRSVDAYSFRAMSSEASAS